ncbi:MAG TPA: hypothetical protein VIV11_32445 [Kofleriaceae bacterium]
MRHQLALSAVLLATGAAHAGRDDAPQLVVVNAAPSANQVGPIERLRRVLDSHKLLVDLDEDLEATLDGRAATIPDLDAIRDAYASSEFETALVLIDTNERRILHSRDPAPLLAQLGQWRGMIAAAQDNGDEALLWLRAAYRLNPALVIDEKLTSPRLRSLIKRAKREPTHTGTLRIVGEPSDARVSIDGGQARGADDRFTLSVGLHLVTIIAPKRKPHSELIEIEPDRMARISIRLDDESTLDRAARLVDATAAAPEGRPRLKRASALAKLTGVSRLLVIEGGGADRVTYRLYDVSANKVSKPLELDGASSSATIAREIAAASESQNLVDIDVMVATARGESAQPRRWYARWYVWAAVGAVAVGSYAAYDYASREPTMLRGL